MNDKTLTAASIALGLLAGPAWAVGAEDDVKAAQAARIAATIKADLPALGRLLGDDLTYTHSNAKLETKAQFLEAIRAGVYQYRSITLRDVTARLYGDAAVLSGAADVNVVSSGNPLAIKLRFTEVWVKRSGSWQLTVWQSTRFPEN